MCDWIFCDKCLFFVLYYKVAYLVPLFGDCPIQ